MVMVFDEPQSRNEAILQNLLGADNVLVEPESRIEAILQSILNETAYLEEPQSRMEELLLAVKDDGSYDDEARSRNEAIIIAWLNDEEYTEEPQSRIEELLIAWLASIPKYVLKTVVGKVLSITDAIEAPAEALSVEMLPIQDLHGYDAPWSAGGGVNKLPAMVDGTYEGNGVKAVVKDGVATFSGTTTASGNAFIIPLTEEVTASDSFYYHCLNSEANASLAPTIENSSDTTQNVSLSLSPANRISGNYTNKGGQTYNRIRFYITNGVTISGTYAPMFCTDNTARSYQPYENSCPITGTEECEVVRCGKNLCPVAEESGNKPLWGADVSGMVAFLNTLPAGTYRISNKYKIVTMPSNSTSVYHGGLYVTAMVNGSPQAVNPYSTVLDSSPSAGKIYAEDKPLVITEAQAGNINHCYYYCDSSVHTGTGRGEYKCYDIQVEAGSTATDFVPYDPLSTTLQIEWGDDVGTIYGGHVDAVRGEVVVNKAEIVLDGSQSVGIANWRPSDGTSAWLYSKTLTPSIKNPATGTAPVNILCDKLVGKSYTPIYNGDVGVTAVQGSDIYGIAVRVPVGGLTTATLINEWLAENPLQIVYELATPITIQIDPQTLTMLKNNNTIWSDANGDITLTYRAKAGD